MKSDSWKPWALLAPSLSAVFFLLVIPVCFIVVYSFWLRAPSGADIPAFQFGNYAKFFEDFFYPKILIRTIRISFETVIICVVMGYIPAYFFYRSESRYKQVFLLLIMLPFWVSFIIRTMSWINIMGDSGLINHFLLKIGLIQSPISMLYNEFTVLMGLIMYLLPFMVLNIYVSLEGIDKSLHESAIIDGANGFRRLWHITLPMVSPSLFYVFVMGFIGSFQILTMPLVIFGSGYTDVGGPMNSGLFYSLYLYNRAFEAGRMGYACALAWILFAIILAITMFNFFVVGRRVYYED